MLQLTDSQASHLVGFVESAVEHHLSMWERSQEEEADAVAVWDVVHAMQKELRDTGVCVISLKDVDPAPAIADAWRATRSPGNDIAREMYAEHSAEHTSGFWLDN